MVCIFAGYIPTMEIFRLPWFSDLVVGSLGVSPLGWLMLPPNLPPVAPAVNGCLGATVDEMQRKKPPESEA